MAETHAAFERGELLEDMIEDELPSASGREESHMRALLSGVLTLTLSILGRYIIKSCTAMHSR